MRIGMIDVDCHNFPNLALMKLSAWHKARGDTVEWWFGWEHYDIVYMAKVFSDSYTPDKFTPANADKVIRGGSGYAIRTINGVEVYDPDLDKPLEFEVEHTSPDYSLYPSLTKDTAYGRLTVGCPKQCSWCHVCAMQGNESRKVASLDEFWYGHKNIVLMDANILACPDWAELLVKLARSGAFVDFNQGLDICRIDDSVINGLNRCRIPTFRFAWDDPAIDLTDQFAFVGENLRVRDRRHRQVYVMVNYGGDTLDDALRRIYILRSLNFDPYVMIYDKPHAPQVYRDLQRWCNNKIIFGAEPDFEMYRGRT